jgi:DNA-directed RNA polymerase subunit beta'
MSLPGSTKTLILPSEITKPVIDFDAVRLKLASPEEVLSWSHGEVLLPETINYRTQKPERDGLFGEQIFGPVKDWECSCGKYKKVRFRGIVCDRCGVEVTRSLVRRERMGHIALSAPVTHIWFLRSLPSRIGLLLDISGQALEKVVYFASFIIIEVKEELKQTMLEQLDDEFKSKKKFLEKEYSGKASEYNKQQDEFTKQYQTVKKDIEEIRKGNIISEIKYRELSLRYGHLFEAGIGAEALAKMLKGLDIKKLEVDLEKEKRRALLPAKKKKIVQRIKLIKNLLVNNIKPEWMILNVIPVIPPDLRPMVQLDGGRFASSDLNDLYRRVINRNNRLKRLKELNAPEVILRNEKRMLQEAVDALIDNDMRSGKTVVASTGQRRSLKSLADILKGKEGRFRQNLLGKRVDYSGRSVIVVGPHLKLYQCGLPKTMAVELFRPFVVGQLIKRGLVHNVRSANRFIETGVKEVWDILEEIIRDAYVFLNRAPSLHRLSVQAFKPILIEGKAIQIHPLVCAAFNADFDGDQMAVHVPITEQGVKEAGEIILSSKNLLKPATGEPIALPSKDMVWGAYYLTTLRTVRSAEQMKAFSDASEAEIAYDAKKITLQEKIKVRIDGQLKEISMGRLVFNSIFPADIYHLDKVVDKKVLKSLIMACLNKYGTECTVQLLDDIKELTLKYITESGLSWGMDDLPDIPGKKEVLIAAEKRIDEIQHQYEMGLLAEDERYLKNIETWMQAKEKIAELCRKTLDPHGSVLSMVESGARGSWTQLTQMLGMKGIVSSPTGRLIELPIKSSYKEGFNELEYFISTHGARKGTSDTALRTATAGYLTRRMVDVSQDIVIHEDDCGDKEGVILTKVESEEMGESVAERSAGRYLAGNIVDPKTKKIILKAGEIVTAEKAQEIAKLDPDHIKIRSILTCKTLRGICAKCYGNDLAFNRPVAMGTPVGIVAAQSIGEPGTQLTLQTFHSGGVAGKDITQGLPRVEELLEVRPPKRPAILAKHDGLLQIVEENKQKKMVIKYEGLKEDAYILEEEKPWHLKVKHGEKVNTGDILAEIKADKAQDIKKQKITAKHKGEVLIDGEVLKVAYPSIDVDEYDLGNYALLVKDGDKVKAGDQLTDGSMNLAELYELRGREAAQKYIIKEIQYIYSSQGQDLNDKHVEILVRQMFSRVLVSESGDTDLLPGEVIPKAFFEECNHKVTKAGQKIAKAKELLLGITKVSLSTDSFLSSASFQETSRVLINAAVTGRPDYLAGLKENVIIGRLIPAGTGLEEEKKEK